MLNSEGRPIFSDERIRKRSSVALLLSDILLGKCDRAIDRTLNEKDILKVCRYLDEYFLLLKADCQIGTLATAGTVLEEPENGNRGWSAI